MYFSYCTYIFQLQSANFQYAPAKMSHNRMALRKCFQVFSTISVQRGQEETGLSSSSAWAKSWCSGSGSCGTLCCFNTDGFLMMARYTWGFMLCCHLMYIVLCELTLLLILCLHLFVFYDEPARQISPFPLESPLKWNFIKWVNLIMHKNIISISNVLENEWKFNWNITNLNDAWSRFFRSVENKLFLHLADNG